MKSSEKMPLGLAVGIAFGLLTAGCGGGPAVPPAASKTSDSPPIAVSAPKSVPPGAPKAGTEGPTLSPLAYDPKGRRDPFAPISTAREKAAGLDVATVKLVGVIRGGHLLALVEAPDGLGYILKPGDVLGNGRVMDVTLGSVTFSVPGAAAAPGSEKRETNVTLNLSRE